MGFRDLKCKNGAQNQNLREKLSKTGPVEKFWLWSKSTVKVNDQLSKSTIRVNCQRMTCADVAVWRHLGLTWQEEKQQQARVAREWEWTGAWGAREARGRYWRRVAARGAHAREAETLADAWRCVWCSFWLFLVGFCSGLAVLSFYACSLAVECTERWYLSVAVLWAWRWWLASDSDDWMKARAAEERWRCPQEPESQRNGSDTMLTI